MPRMERVLISGAGLAGPALAIRLKALGLAVDLLERREALAAVGAGILLTGNALRALSALDPRIDVGARVLAAALRVDRIRFTDDANRELFHVDCAADPGWPPFASIQREALQRILLDAAAPIVPRWGTTIAALREDRDAVEVELSDGTRAHYDLVAGADGLHSNLRERLFAARRPEPIAGFYGWRFLAPCPSGLPGPQYMLGNGRTMLLHPMPGGEVYCGAGPVVETELRGESELERFRRAFESFADPAREVVARVSDGARLIPTRYWQIEQRPWHRGRCLLIGDAAHASAPTLAQGGAMAFEDACVLGELLASVREDRMDLESALQAFEDRRAPRIAHVQRASLQRMQANQPIDARAMALRKTLLAKLGAAQLIKDWAPLMEESP